LALRLAHGPRKVFAKAAGFIEHVTMPAFDFDHFDC
jgi:hypothetical protein